MFDALTVKESRAAALLKRAALALFGLCALTALASGHRAYFQVRSLQLRADGPTLRAGSVVGAEVVTSGRTTVDVRVELLQGSRADTLGVLRVRGNGWAAIDPRTRGGALSLTLTPEALARFDEGPATLRATATGRPQWMRLPPPTVSESAVEVRRE